MERIFPELEKQYENKATIDEETYLEIILFINILKRT